MGRPAMVAYAIAFGITTAAAVSPATTSPRSGLVPGTGDSATATFLFVLQRLVHDVGVQLRDPRAEFMELRIALDVLLAALRIVQSRSGISSQLIDNLNVSTHLRAVLTDLFLLDEALKSLG